MGRNRIKIIGLTLFLLLFIPMAIVAGCKYEEGSKVKFKGVWLKKDTCIIHADVMKVNSDCTRVFVQVSKVLSVLNTNLTDGRFNGRPIRLGDTLWVDVKDLK